MTNIEIFIFLFITFVPRIEHLDIGGGLGIKYKNETPPIPSEYLANVLPEIERRGLKLVLEPGRSVIANAGILATKVLFTKESIILNRFYYLITLCYYLLWLWFK